MRVFKQTAESVTVTVGDMLLFYARDISVFRDFTTNRPADRRYTARISSRTTHNTPHNLRKFAYGN